MSEAATTVNVHILGREYHIACASDEVDALLASAQELEQRMREIRQGGRVLEHERIAVMAALNVIHESRQLQRDLDTATALDDDIGQLAERIADAVAGAHPPRGDD